MIHQNPYLQSPFRGLKDAVIDKTRQSKLFLCVPHLQAFHQRTCQQCIQPASAARSLYMTQHAKDLSRAGQDRRRRRKEQETPTACREEEKGGARPPAGSGSNWHCCQSCSWQAWKKGKGTHQGAPSQGTAGTKDRHRARPDRYRLPTLNKTARI